VLSHGHGVKDPHLGQTRGVESALVWGPDQTAFHYAPTDPSSWPLSPVQLLSSSVTLCPMLCKEIINAFGGPAGFSGTFGLFVFPGDPWINPEELGQH
jgi:hypothetical protein